VSTTSPDITKDIYTATVASNTGSVAFRRGLACELLQLIIIPPSNGCTYKFYIQESLDGLRIFERDEEIKGLFNELVVPNLPLWGDHTLVIYGATNGTYKVRIVYR